MCLLFQLLLIGAAMASSADDSAMTPRQASRASSRLRLLDLLNASKTPPDELGPFTARRPRELGHSSCVMWRQTGGCVSSGNRESWNDKACSTYIKEGQSGYCECAEGGNKYFNCANWGSHSSRGWNCDKKCGGKGHHHRAVISMLNNTSPAANNARARPTTQLPPIGNVSSSKQFRRLLAVRKRGQELERARFEVPHRALRAHSRHDRHPAQAAHAPYPHGQQSMPPETHSRI